MNFYDLGLEAPGGSTNTVTQATDIQAVRSFLLAFNQCFFSLTTLPAIDLDRFLSDLVKTQLSHQIGGLSYGSGCGRAAGKSSPG